MADDHPFSGQPSAVSHLPSAICHLREAVALYRGEFLEGMRASDSPLLEEWLTFERERWRHLYLEMLDRLVEALIAWGDHGQAIAHCREILRVDPLRESAHRQLMWLYWLAGERAMALRQHETCRRLLQGELSSDTVRMQVWVGDTAVGYPGTDGA